MDPQTALLAEFELSFLALDRGEDVNAANEWLMRLL